MDLQHQGQSMDRLLLAKLYNTDEQGLCPLRHLRTGNGRRGIKLQMYECFCW